MLPGDNENDSIETLRYYRLLEQVDVAIPFVFNKEVRSVYRNVLSYLYRTTKNTTFLVNLNYTNGTVLYRKIVLDEIDEKSIGFFFQTDIIIRSLKKGYLFAEVPYKLSTRQTGKSKAITFPSLWQVTFVYSKLVRDLYIRRQSKLFQQPYAVDSVSANRRRVDDE